MTKFALFSLTVIASGLFAQAQDKRPNILFAFADDWGRYASAYAAFDRTPAVNSVFTTPNFDRIAREGVIFTNAYVTSPSCTPCRSSLLSGQYFFRTGMGAILQGAKWDPSIPSYPLMLRDAGYHIGQTYKVWTPGTPTDAPYGAKEHEYESAGTRFNRFSQFVSAAVAKGQSIEDAKQVLYDEVLANFNSFLEARPDGHPFCYWFGPTNVHRRWTRGSAKALWNLDPNTLRGKMPTFLPDVPDVRQDLADYLGEVLAFDTALGLLIKRLQDQGELDNTIIVVSGDHGFPGFPRGKTNLYDHGTAVPLAVRWPGQGKPGRIVHDFINLMDLAPTFLEMGGVPPADVMTGKSFANVLIGNEDGWVDESRSFVVTGRERHVGNARDGHLPYPQRAIRTKDFLYIRNFKPDRWPEGNPYDITETTEPSQKELETDTGATFLDLDAGPTKAWLVKNRANSEAKGKHFYNLAFAKRPAEELYDVRHDSDQITNIAEDKEYAKILTKLSKQLMHILTEANDPRVSGNGSTFDKMPYTVETGLKR